MPAYMYIQTCTEITAFIGKCIEHDDLAPLMMLSMTSEEIPHGSPRDNYNTRDTPEHPRVHFATAATTEQPPF